MSFSTDLYYLMSTDTSLNSYCENGIHYKNLPENFELTKNWVVYSFNKISQLSCLESVILAINYNIFVDIISNSTEDLETISDYLVNYLNGKTYNKISYIIFIEDNHSLDLEKQLYKNSLIFEAIYI